MTKPPKQTPVLNNTHFGTNLISTIQIHDVNEHIRKGTERQRAFRYLYAVWKPNMKEYVGTFGVEPF